MNFAESDYVMTNTPGMLRAMGDMITQLGVKPEIEAFDTGHLMLARGQFATNAQLVERAVSIIENMGATVIGPDQVRERLNLTKRTLA